jgi:hypothetical protein
MLVTVECKLQGNPDHCLNHLLSNADLHLVQIMGEFLLHQFPWKINTIMLCVVERHRFYSPDLTFCFDADPDPDPNQDTDLIFTHVGKLEKALTLVQSSASLHCTVSFSVAPKVS